MRKLATLIGNVYKKMFCSDVIFVAWGTDLEFVSRNIERMKR